MDSGISVDRKMETSGGTHSCDDLLNLLFMTLHLQDTPNLSQVHVLPVSERDNLIKRAKNLEGILQNLAFIGAAAEVGDSASKEVEGVNILKDVGGFVGDEEDVEIFEGLVDVADVCGLDGGVLGIGGDQLGERGEEGLDPGLCHVTELA